MGCKHKSSFEGNNKMLTRKNLNTIIGRLADAEPDVVAEVLSEQFGVVVMCVGDNWNSPILYVGSDGVQKNLLLPVIDADAVSYTHLTLPTNREV